MGRLKNYAARLVDNNLNKLDVVFPSSTIQYPVDVTLRTKEDNASILDWAIREAGKNQFSQNVDPTVQTEVDRNADMFAPNEIIDPATFTSASSIWKHVFEWDPSITTAVTGQFRPMTVGELQSLQNEISSLQSSNPGSLELKSKLETFRIMKDLLNGFIRFTADQVQFACYYLRSIAIDYTGNPSDPVMQGRLDNAVDTVEAFFQEVSLPGGQTDRTPVRYVYDQILGDAYVPDGEKSKNGHFSPAQTVNRVYLRTDLSREGFYRPIECAAELYRASTDPTQRQRLRDAVTAAFAELARHGHEGYEGPGSFVYFSLARQVRRDPRISFARPLLTFFPALDQVDALRGSDKIFAYALLRCAAEMDVDIGAGTNYGALADAYFAANANTMEITSTELLFRFAGKKLRQVAADALDIFSERIGGFLINLVLFLLFIVFALVLLAIIFPPLAVIPILILLLPLAVLVILSLGPGNTKLYPQFFDSLYDSISLEGQVCAFLKRFDTSSNNVGQQMWEVKLLQMAVLERQKVDALFQGYFVETDVGRDAMARNLVNDRARLAQLDLAYRRARARLRSNPLSSSAQTTYAQAYAALTAFKQVYDFSWRVQYNVRKAAPEKLIRANYARSYLRDFEFFNSFPGQWEDPAATPEGSIDTKINWLNQNLLPLTFGNDGIGFHSVGPLSNPPSFPIVTRIADFGDVARVLLFQSPESEQHAVAPAPEYWANRTSIVNYNPFQFKDTGRGNVDWAAGEFHLSLALINRLLVANGEPDLVEQIDQLNP